MDPRRTGSWRCAWALVWRSAHRLASDALLEVMCILLQAIERKTLYLDIRIARTQSP